MRDRPYFPGFRSREAMRANTAAIAAKDAGDYERAEVLLRYALTLKPRLWALWLNLGNAVQALGRYDRAIEYFSHAHRLAPLDPEPLINLAHAKLMVGQYREGWALYEERWRKPDFLVRTGSGIVVEKQDERAKKWDGIARPGKRLFIFNEQGGGDVVMMLRYREMLEQTGMQLLWQVPAGFLRLLQYHKPSFGEVFTNMEATPEHDYHAPMMSLPYLFGSEKHTLPKAPYLNQSWVDEAVLALPGLRVGICWRGQPGHKADNTRSCGLEVLRPLFEISGISWVNLTVGEKAANEIRQAQITDYPIHQLVIPTSFDYFDTASVVKALDLVITVDSSVLHLAGALGVPTLGLIPRPSEWRWGVECSAKHWYSSVELIKQKTFHDWTTVVAEIKGRLTARVRWEAA